MVSESEKPASSTWKAWFAALAARKEDKMARLQSKLKQQMKSQEQQKAGQAIKTISTAAAQRIENKGKLPQPGAAAAKPVGHFRLADVKQQSKAFAKATWAAR